MWKMGWFEIARCHLRLLKIAPFDGAHLASFVRFSEIGLLVENCRFSPNLTCIWRLVWIGISPMSLVPKTLAGRRCLRDPMFSS